MLKKTFYKAVKRGCERYGIEIARRELGEPVPTTELEHPTLALYERGDVAFEVPIEKCQSLFQFSYAPKGWHPFVQTLKQVRAKPEIDYETSTLHTFYDIFRPQTVRDVLLGPAVQNLSSSRFADFKIAEYHPFFPWDARQRRPKGERGLDASHGHQGFGPVSPTKGKLEFELLVNIYRSIKEKGYVPKPSYDGDIRGFFLKTDDDYRFVVRQGLHRVPALSVLGYDRVRVKFFHGIPRAIFLSDLHEWPQVKQGIVTQEEAEQIFHLFFESGIAKARDLGLLD